MPSKIMLFNTVEPEEIRGVISEEGHLVEYDIESQTREKNKNNIYYGTVVKIEPSIQACFVDYGGNRHGFLALGDIDEEYWSQKPNNNNNRRTRIDEVMRVGQPLLVQVVREEIEQKGAALTTYFSLPGRYVVLMARGGQSGISRKIEERSERKTLREIMRNLNVPDELSYILRTSCVGRTFEEVEREVNYLVRLWRSVKNKEKQMRKRKLRSALIFQEANLVERMIRDYYDDQIQEIYIDNKKFWESAVAFIQEFLPNRPTDNVHLYNGKRPLFSEFGVEHAIQGVYQRKIALPSGGSIVIDPTEALVSIDVNSGKTQSDRGTEETALKANLEAAEEIARQLRLRDLGGLVVIDYISMRSIRNVREVEKTFRGHLKRDKARIKMGRISHNFGLLSLSRQRIRDSKEYTHFVACPSCAGVGKLPNVETSAMIVLRELKDLAAQSRFERIDANLPQQVAYYLLNQKRREISKLEKMFDLQILIYPRGGLSIDLEKDLATRNRTRPPRRPQKKSTLAQVAPPSSVEDGENNDSDSSNKQSNEDQKEQKGRDNRDNRDNRRDKSRESDQVQVSEPQTEAFEASDEKQADSEQQQEHRRERKGRRDRRDRRDRDERDDRRDQRGRRDRSTAVGSGMTHEELLAHHNKRFHRSLHTALQDCNGVPWFVGELSSASTKPSLADVAQQFSVELKAPEPAAEMPDNPSVEPDATKVEAFQNKEPQEGKPEEKQSKSAKPQQKKRSRRKGQKPKYEGGPPLIPDDADPEDFIPPPPPPAVMP